MVSSRLGRGLEEAKEPGASNGQKHRQGDVSGGQDGRVAQLAFAAVVAGDVFDAQKALSIVLVAFILRDTVLPLDELLASSSSVDGSTNLPAFTGDH